MTETGSGCARDEDGVELGGTILRGRHQDTGVSAPCSSGGVAFIPSTRARIPHPAHPPAARSGPSSARRPPGAWGHAARHIGHERGRWAAVHAREGDDEGAVVHSRAHLTRSPDPPAPATAGWSAERLRGLEVDYQLQLAGCSVGRSAGRALENTVDIRCSATVQIWNTYAIRHESARLRSRNT